VPGHVVERVSQAYERRGEVMMPVQGAGGGVGGGFGCRQGDLEILLSSRLREMLKDVCGDANLSFVGYGRA